MPSSEASSINVPVKDEMDERFNSLPRREQEQNMFVLLIDVLSETQVVDDQHTLNTEYVSWAVAGVWYLCQVALLIQHVRLDILPLHARRTS